MSILSVTLVKQDLHVTHTLDDAIIQAHLDASEDEALQFMDRTSFGPLPDLDSNGNVVSESSSSEPAMPASVRSAILFLVRSKYDTADPAEVEALRKAAETLLMPFREHLGV